MTDELDAAKAKAAASQDEVQKRPGKKWRDLQKTLPSRGTLTEAADGQSMVCWSYVLQMLTANQELKEKLEGLQADLMGVRAKSKRADRSLVQSRSSPAVWWRTRRGCMLSTLLDTRKDV